MKKNFKKKFIFVKNVINVICIMVKKIIFIVINAKNAILSNKKNHFIAKIAIHATIITFKNKMK